MALYQNCITIKGVKTLRMRETAANTTIATKRRQSWRSKTQLERKNCNEPGPYPQNNYMGTARKYKKTLVFWRFWPSSNHPRQTHLSLVQSDSDSPPFQPSVTEPWVGGSTKTPIPPGREGATAQAIAITTPEVETPESP